MKFSVLLFSLSFFLLSCGSKGKGEANAEDSISYMEPGTERLVKKLAWDSSRGGRKLALDSHTVDGSYVAIYCVDTFLLCVTGKDTMAIHVYSGNSFAKLGEIVKVGEGKGECLNIFSIVPVHEKNKTLCWVYDMTLKKMFSIDIRKALDGSKKIFTGQEILLSGDARNLSSPVNAGDSIFLATSYSLPDCRYFYLTASSTVLKKCGRLPPPRPKWPADEGKGQFNIVARSYNAKLAQHPTHKYVAVAYRNTDRIDIFKNDTLSCVLRGPGNFEPLRTFYRQDGVLISKETARSRIAYTGIQALGDYLYLTYSGKPKESISDEAVMVIDWNGNVVNVFVPEKKLRSTFMLNKKGATKVFALDETGTNILTSEIN
jgi:hypothetical protein